MRKISFLILFIMCFNLLMPVNAETTDIYLGFNKSDSNDFALLKSSNGTKISEVSGISGKGAKLTNTNKAVSAYVDFETPDKNSLVVAQAIKPAKNTETQIRILAGGKTAITITFAAGEIRTISGGKPVRLRAYSDNQWYKVVVHINTLNKTYKVSIDGIDFGGELSYSMNSELPNGIQYISYGLSANTVSLDEIMVFEENQVSQSSGGSTVSAARTAYYSTYRPRYDSYKLPTENVVPGLEVTGDISTSSVADGYDAKALIDNNNSTIWKAAPAAKPVDNGRSLILTKNSATDGMQTTAYSFAPVKGTIVIEQDVLGSDVVQEKAIPYVFASNGNMIATLLMSGGNFLIAGSSTAYRDINADTWYHIKIEINTETQTYNIYIDDKIWCKDISFRSASGDVAKIQYHQGANSFGQCCVDNIKVYTISPLGLFEKMIFEEDFEDVPLGATSVTGWSISPSSDGKVSVDKYDVSSEYKFTQYATIGFGREVDLEGAYFYIPDGIALKYTVSIARSNGVMIPVMERTDRFYSGEQKVYFSPVRATTMRIIISDAVDNMGNTTHAQLSEIKGILKHRAPVENVAFSAQVSVSGTAGAMYDEKGINDNIVAEFGNIGEWISGSEEDKWVELNWDTPQTVDRIILHDSASLTDHTKSGILTFDDGSKIEVNEIKNSGYPKTIDFPAKTIQKLRFTITDYDGRANLSELQVFSVGEKPELPIYLEPDKVVKLDPSYTGRWCNINDIDNDGELEYICSRAVNLIADNHYTGSIGAQEADGTIIWTWGDPTISSSSIGSDLPTQIHDYNNDGKLEVFVCDTENLYILNAADGAELKRYKLPTSEKYPESLSCDTIIFADISGKGYAGDIMVKNRYNDVWAYTSDWQLIWHTCWPGDKKVGHYPQPIDIDNDGYDEVIVGFACIDEDGSIIFDMKQEQYPGRLETGHKDSLEVINFVLTGDVTGDLIINQKDMDRLNDHLQGEITLEGNYFIAADTDGNGKIEENDKILLEQKLSGELLAFPNKGLPKEEQRFCLTPCGGGANIIMIDGNGNRVWSLDDATHYETIEKADFGLTDYPFELVVTNTSITQGNMPFEILDLEGNLLGTRYGYMRNRQLNPINWNGEGETEYIVLPTDNIVIDGNFNVKLKPLMPRRGYDTMAMKSYQTGNKKYTCDMDGDGTTDIVIQMDADNTTYLYIYYNKNGAKVADDIGRGYNISQY